MNEQELAHYLDHLGAHLAQWPEPLKQSAQQLMADSVAARELYQEAAQVADLFAAAQTHQAPPNLQQQILRRIESVAAAEQAVASTRRHRFPTGWLEWWVGSPWRSAVTALIPLVIGFSTGWNTATGEQAEFWTTQSEDAVYGLTLSDSVQEYYSEES